jgi:prolyl-tRNA editing enzyme YbaK/EbsC (Cys-tRNA(Pro) deacylase)
MNQQYEEKLIQYIKENKILAEHLHFEKTCHTVEEAAKAVNARAEDFVKSICLIDSKGSLVVAIVLGTERVSLKKVAKFLNIELPRIAKPDEILKLSGYPCGGVPPFGFPAKFLIDEKVMKKEIVYAGGGSENSLIKIPVKEIKKANKGEIVRIRK